jgi:hypothetical protein
MSIALKLLPKKLLLIPPQLLQWIQMHQMCCSFSMQPKRPRTDDDAGDAHEVIAEVENWDLRDHRQQATRMQNRRNVQLGSRQNQAQPRTGTDDFLHHKRLELVGWIAYWCLGDSALAGDIIVALIKTLGPPKQNESFVQRHQSFWAWLQHTDNATHLKSKENLNFWSERPAEYAK